MQSDKALKAAILADFDSVSFRFVADWNEYQLTAYKDAKGKADWSKAEFFDKPHDKKEQPAIRAEILEAAQRLHTMPLEGDIEFLMDSARGQYLPRDFAESAIENFPNAAFYIWRNVPIEYWQDLLKGPESESYWDSWAHILDNVSIKFNGCEYWLIQAQDLFMYRDTMTQARFESAFVY